VRGPRQRGDGAAAARPRAAGSVAARRDGRVGGRPLRHRDATVKGKSSRRGSERLSAGFRAFLAGPGWLQMVLARL